MAQNLWDVCQMWQPARATDFFWHGQFFELLAQYLLNNLIILNILARLQKWFATPVL